MRTGRGIAHDFRCGDRVCDTVDPRHVGRITFIQDGIWATVEWRKGLVEEQVRLSRLVHAVDPRVEAAAQRFVVAVIESYGLASALERARIVRHEYSKEPQWLTRAIEIMEEKAHETKK